MEKVIIWVFVFILIMGVVFSADGWEDIDMNDSVGGSEGLVVGDEEVESDVGDLEDVVVSLEGGTFYTDEFYIAMGLIVFVFIIIGVFVLLWLRGSKNKWD